MAAGVVQTPTTEPKQTKQEFEMASDYTQPEENPSETTENHTERPIDQLATAMSPEPASEANPLLIDFPRFLANEITDAEMRTPINRAHAAFNGIRTLGKILRANEVERQANQGEWSLPASDQEALFQSVLILADVGFHDLENLGEYLTTIHKGGM